jgi:cell division septum initiation protein DivIVA
MFTQGISDQLADSFQELMQEIRAMRRELEGIRAALREHEVCHASPATTPTATRARRTKKAA